jgi:hypothetical protein
MTTSSTCQQQCLGIRHQLRPRKLIDQAMQVIAQLRKQGFELIANGHWKHGTDGCGEISVFSTYIC